MDKSISERNLDPLDFNLSIGDTGEFSTQEAPDIISILAIESLSMGSETSVNKELNKSQVKISDLGDVEDIERLMQESLLDTENIDDEELIDLSDTLLFDIVDGEIDLEIPNLDVSDEYFDEVIFSESSESGPLNSIETIESASTEFLREFVIEEDLLQDQAIFKLLKEVKDPKNILVTFSSNLNGETTKLKKEILEKYIKEGKLVYDKRVSKEVIDSFSKNEIEFSILSESDWEKHVKLVYLATLGVRISGIRDVSFNQKDMLEQEVEKKNISLSKTYRFQNSEYLSENIVTQNFQKSILTKIILSGILLSNLKNIENCLLRRREDRKEEIRQENLKKVVDQYIQSEVIQRSLMLWDIKKEKIWFENTTSFLRFLLKRDRKLSLFKR